MKKKICISTNTLYTNKLFREYFIDFLLQHDFEVHLIAPVDNTEKYFSDKGCQIHHVVLGRKGTNPFHDLALTYQYVQIFKKIRPSLILNYTIKPNIYGSFAAWCVKIPSMCIVTGLGYSFINNTPVTRIVKLLYKIAFSLTKTVFLLNEEDSDFLLKSKILVKDKIRILPGEGVNTKHFSPIPKLLTNDSPLRFFFIGRLLIDKGILNFLEAAKNIISDVPNISFVIVGRFDEGNPRTISKEVLNSFLLPNQITYLEESEDIKKELISCSCLVLPSYREGMSKILLEGASMALPIITTNVPGCREIVEDLVTGMLCRVKDTNDLIKKIKEMIALPIEKKTEMGESGRKRVIERFEETVVLEFYKNMLREQNLL